MQGDLIFTHAAQLYNELKFWLAIGAFMFSVFRVIQWFKELKTNDLTHIQASLNDLHGKLDEQTEVLKEGFSTQTRLLVDELKELRADFRTYIAPSLLQAQVQRVKSSEFDKMA